MPFRMNMALFARDDGEARAVVNAKYKMGGVPAEADVQQVVAYALQLGGSPGIFIVSRSEVHTAV